MPALVRSAQVMGGPMRWCLCGVFPHFDLDVLDPTNSMQEVLMKIVLKFAFLVSGVLAAGALLSGCVTTEQPVQPASVSEAEVSNADAPETAAITPETVAAEPSEWQSTLSEDLEAVESLGQTFLESSFALYDKLLKEDITEKDTEAARAAVEDCRTKYNDMVAAIERLRGSLNRTEVREALPLSVEGNKEELDELLNSLAAYVPAKFNREDYTVGEGKYLTAMMFPGLPEDMPEYMASLPKANRDALLLLDHLKRISGDLTSMSSTLTAWIYDAASFDAEAFVH